MSKYRRSATPDKGYRKVKVVKASFHEAGANSIFKHWVELGSWWALTLECGCETDRGVRFKSPRARHSWQRRHDFGNDGPDGNPSNLKPPPKFVYHKCPKTNP